MSHLTSDPANDWADRANRALREPSHGLENLRNYLAGVGTPSFDRSTEDYMWLLQAIGPVGLDRGLLTSLTVRLLELDFGMSQPPRKPRYVHNMLSLCAGLGAADASAELAARTAGWRRPRTGGSAGRGLNLAGPLARVYRQKLVPEAGTPSSEHRGVPLVADLCTALIANQKDDSLTEDWVELLTFWPTKPHYLAETPMAGFDGVLGMPCPPRPALVALALREMSRFLDESPERADQFKELLNRVCARYKGDDLELDDPYYHYDWKPWAKGWPGALARQAAAADVTPSKIACPATLTSPRVRRGLRCKKGKGDDVQVFAAAAGSDYVAAGIELTFETSLPRSDLAVESVKNAAYEATFHCRKSGIDLDRCSKFVEDQMAATAAATAGKVNPACRATNRRDAARRWPSA